jgi:rSAM/selenodomain-associated transferase 2
MRVSVIIPTLNEENCLAQTLEHVRLHNPHEIIVVDGGSTDRTREIAATTADLFVQAPRGRGSQMNEGAKVASGKILVFLHADCMLETGALASAEECLLKPGVAAGCFSMVVASPGVLYRWIDFVADVRVRFAGLIYGDQGMFVRRNLFAQLGGFPTYKLMEDVFFSRTLRRHGRLAVAMRRIFVSPRRWRRNGIVRQTIGNWALLGLAAGGVHPDRLADWYPVIR